MTTTDAKLYGAKNNLTGHSYAVQSVSEDGCVTLVMDKQRTMTLPPEKFQNEWTPFYSN